MDVHAINVKISSGASCSLHLHQTSISSGKPVYSMDSNCAYATTISLGTLDANRTKRAKGQDIKNPTVEARALHCPINSCKKVIWKHGLIDHIAAEHHADIPEGVGQVEWGEFEDILGGARADVLKGASLAEDAKDAWEHNKEKLQQLMEKMGPVLDKDLLLVSVSEIIQENGLAHAAFKRTKGSKKSRKGSKHNKGQKNRKGNKQKHGEDEGSAEEVEEGEEGEEGEEAG